MESMISFDARVLEATGLRLADIPAGEPADLLGGSILCRRGDTVIVTSGYPDREDDGISIWDARPENFRRVDGIAREGEGCADRCTSG